MADKQEFLILFFRDGDSKSIISRDLKVDRKTIRKYILEYFQELEKEKNAGTHVEGALARYISEKPKYKARTSPKVALTEEVAEG